MKPIWERYERREKDERLTGFWILLFAMIIAVLGTIFYNIACLVFAIVFALSTVFSPIVVRICDICFHKLGIPTSTTSKIQNIDDEDL